MVFEQSFASAGWLYLQEITLSGLNLLTLILTFALILAFTGSVVA